MQLNAVFVAFLRLYLGCQPAIFPGRQLGQSDSPDAAISIRDSKDDSEKYHKRQRKNRSC